MCQGSFQMRPILTPLLFNFAMAPLPECRPGICIPTMRISTKVDKIGLSRVQSLHRMAAVAEEACLTALLFTFKRFGARYLLMG